MGVLITLSADRLIQIEDNTIVSGTVVNGDLILQRKNGTTINAGRVQGSDGIAQYYISGMYYGPEGGRSSAVQTFNRLITVPFFVPKPTAFNRIGAAVVVAGGAGSTYRAGIYEDNGFGKPGDLIVQGASTPAVTVASTEQTISVTLQRGLYWLAAVVQGSTAPAPSMRTVVDAIVGGSGADALVRGTAASPYIGWMSAGATVTGALPATFGDTSAVTAAPILVVLRAA